MSFTAKDVKELRDQTGAGMMACKEALKENNGDIELATDYLRKKGLAAAQKKQTRTAAEGKIVTAVEGNLGILLEVNCETDFVSKGDDFQQFSDMIANVALKNKPKTIEELITMTAPSGKTVSEEVNQMTLKCGEKVDVRRLEITELSKGGLISSYNHGGRIGVIASVETEADVTAPLFQDLVKDLGMHIAAASPRFVNSSDIDESFKERESAIYTAQLKEEGKPETMIPKIVQGKLGKLASEVCLMEQSFVKDPDQKIKALLASVGKEIGGVITVTSFQKLNLGEGIEKREDNLADEVAKMTGQK